VNISLRISTFSAVTVGFVALFLVVIFHQVSHHTTSRVADAVHLGNQLIWDQLVFDQLAALAALEAEIENEFDLRSAIKRAELNEVREFAGRYFQLTGDAGKFDQLLILGKEKTIYYQSGNTSDLPALAAYLDRAIDKPEPVTDLVLDRNGRLFAMAVITVESRRGLNGFAVYLKSLDDVVERLANRSGHAIAVTGIDGTLQIDTGLAGGASAAFDGIDEGPILTTWSDGNRRFQVSRQPLHNGHGEILGHLLVSSDATDQLAQARHFELGAYAALVVVLGVAWFGYAAMAKRYIVRPALALRDHLQFLAEGDFSRRLAKGRSNDEFAQIADSVNLVSDRLGNVVAELNGVAHALVDASTEMEQTSAANLALLKNQQNETVHASSAITEMAQTIEDIARNASQTAAQAQAADELTEHGAQLVSEVVQAMRNLSQQVEASASAVRTVESESAQIGSVLQVIQEISEQTNLLALNASIEAARAGEQGRGFAVVADEVRMLATRTQASTSQIKDTIDRLQRGTRSVVEAMDHGRAQAEATVALVDSAGDALTRINASVTSITDANIQIAGAAEQQNAVTTEAQRNIVAIRDLAHEIVEKGESVRTASQSVNALATRIDSLSRYFSV
jgi:methyl-accepting chemotaxis protein